MNKEPFLAISEVSKRLEIPSHTLRYWEKQFPTAIKPMTGNGGRRYYRAEVVEALFRIKDLLYVQGYTIAGVKKLISDGALKNESETVPVKVDIVQKNAESVKPNSRSQKINAQSGVKSNDWDKFFDEDKMADNLFAHVNVIKGQASDIEIQRALELLRSARAMLG